MEPRAPQNHKKQEKRALKNTAKEAAVRTQILENKIRKSEEDLKMMTQQFKTYKAVYNERTQAKELDFKFEINREVLDRGAESRRG